MKRPVIQTKQITIPSGFTITAKAKKSYGDSVAIRNKALGEASVTDGMSSMTFAQANNLIMTTLVVMITAWDVTEEDGTPTPLTEDNMKAIFTDEDVNFLSEKINSESEPDPKS